MSGGLNIKTSHLVTFLTMLCMSIMLVNFTAASNDFTEASPVTICRDGTITPSTAPITRLGSTYILTGDIINQFLDLNCNNVIINGAGHVISIEGLTYQADQGISIQANNVMLAI